jgi:hypothetical protein
MATAGSIDTEVIRDIELDKELSDVLFAISVITRQLAKKIIVNHQLKEETEDEKHRNHSII